MEAFSEFFTRATGFGPHKYQERLARDGLPAVIEAPTGAGKTGVILAWLWRRLHGPDLAGTPRRLIFALPQRTLVEQVAREAGRWLENLGLADEVALHVVMGGAGETQRQWRLDMHWPAIVVGTVDSLVSKALNRGYGIARAAFPVDFALVMNGAHWVADEVQLCPESTTTLRQLAAFARAMGTAEPFGLTCMSATIPGGLLGTVDNPEPEAGEVVRILPEERTGDLAVRLSGTRTVRRLDTEPGSYVRMAAELAARHRPGTLTLAVLNTVAAARQVFTRLAGGGAPCTLLHSRFRGVEREGLIGEITKPLGEAGRIVVATQVVEAGVDLNAAVLFTEAAPWPSVVQRAGRCNRSGRIEDAELWWLPPAKHHPYAEEDVAAAAAELTSLEGEAVTGEELARRAVPVTQVQVAVLRRPDLIALFDTAPDLTGADIDISPYVRDADDLDVQLAWAEWEPASGAPPQDARLPEARWRCRVPVGQIGEIMKKGIAIWRLDQAAGSWSRVDRDHRARPGEVLLMRAADGCYDPRSGFDPDVKAPVPGCPVLGAPVDLAAGSEDAFAEDSASLTPNWQDKPEPDGWLALEQHSADVRDQAAALAGALEPSLDDRALRSVVTAGYAHDAGKWHPLWQDALCALAKPGEAAWIQAGRPWAKSGGQGRLRYGDGVTFRHELASLLMLSGPLRGLLGSAGAEVDADLVRYLVLAHHGRLRVSVRGPADADPGVLLGLKHGEERDVPPLLGQPAGRLAVDLEQFALGGEQSWTRIALALRDQYGPFVLAYLEAVVRMADWRASAGLPRAEAKEAAR
jgi:CRISPR-associated endonuclease/helicase Cas3